MRVVFFSMVLEPVIEGYKERVLSVVPLFSTIVFISDKKHFVVSVFREIEKVFYSILDT